MCGLTGGEEETLETSAISIFSDEGLDLSQRINESVFAGPDLDPDGEEIIMGKLDTLLAIKLC